MNPTDSKVPKHIGIILDGNRRFAKRLVLKPWKGHEYGYEKLKKVMDWADELGIKELTLYAFSVENFNRPKEEFDFLMDLFRKACDEFKQDKKVKEKKIRINFIGRTWMFPKDLQQKMQEVVDMTKKHNGLILNMAMAYGGRAEIIDATKRIAEAVKNGDLDVNEINEETFKEHLYLESEPDLIIRTSGEQRTSGFLLWQGSYAELYFTEKLWPEFEKEDLIKAIDDYSQRERRFGK